MRSLPTSKFATATVSAPPRITILAPSLPSADDLLPYLRRIDAVRTYTNWGPLTDEFEARIAAAIGCPRGCVISASSGTAALAAALLATAGAGGMRSTAMVPDFTFVATALAAEMAGFRPFIADVDPLTWTLQPTALDVPRVGDGLGMIVPVAPYGRAVAQASWLEMRQRCGLPVVIDGGASFESILDHPELFLGAIPVALSFHATKSFSTGEGGCVVTTDARLARRVREALNFGFYGSRNCVRASLNGKMSEYHAAVGLASLDTWPVKRAALERVALEYRQRLQHLDLERRLTTTPLVCSSYILFECVSADEARRVSEGLEAAAIESRFWYGRGLHSHDHFLSAPRGPVPCTTDLADRLVALPVSPDLPAAAVDRVTSALALAVRQPARG